MQKIIRAIPAYNSVWIESESMRDCCSQSAGRAIGIERKFATRHTEGFDGLGRRPQWRLIRRELYCSRTTGRGALSRNIGLDFQDALSGAWSVMRVCHISFLRRISFDDLGPAALVSVVGNFENGGVTADFRYPGITDSFSGKNR